MEETHWAFKGQDNRNNKSVKQEDSTAESYE